MLATNGAIPDLDVIAYAGFPIRGRDGEPIGSLCAIDGAPRQWSDADLELLEQLADVVSDLIAMRTTSMRADDRQATIGQLVESQEVERTRIAADLHDDTLQVLSALSIRLQLLGRDSGPESADQVAALVVDLSDASQRIRRCVTDLRPGGLGHIDLALVIEEHLAARRSRTPRDLDIVPIGPRPRP